MYYSIYDAIGFATLFGDAYTQDIKGISIFIGFIISIIIFFINKNIIDTQEEKIKNKGYWFGFIARVYKPILIIALLIAPFSILIDEKIYNNQRYIIQKYGTELNSILRDEKNNQDTHKTCTNYLKDHRLFSFYIRRQSDISNKEYCEYLEMDIMREKKDPMLCFGIFDKNYVNECIYQVSENVKDCDLIQNDINVKNHCTKKFSN